MGHRAYAARRGMTTRGLVGLGCLALERRVDRSDFEEAVDGSALLVVEPAAELGRVHVGLTLGGGQVAEQEEGAVDGVLAVLGQTADGGHGIANLLALGGGEVLHRFSAGDEFVALLGGHGVELGEALVELGLLLRGQVAEAGLVLQRVLLLGQRQVAMGLHPLGKVLLGLAGTIGRDQLRIGGWRGGPDRTLGAYGLGRSDDQGILGRGRCGGRRTGLLLLSGGRRGLALGDQQPLGNDRTIGAVYLGRNGNRKG